MLERCRKRSLGRMPHSFLALLAPMACGKGGHSHSRVHVLLYGRRGLPQLRSWRPLPLRNDVSHRVQVGVLRFRLALYTEGTRAR